MMVSRGFGLYKSCHENVISVDNILIVELSKSLAAVCVRCQAMRPIAHKQEKNAMPQWLRDAGEPH